MNLPSPEQDDLFQQPRRRLSQRIATSLLAIVDNFLVNPLDRIIDALNGITDDEDELCDYCDLSLAECECVFDDDDDEDEEEDDDDEDEDECIVCGLPLDGCECEDECDDCGMLVSECVCSDEDDDDDEFDDSWE